MLDCVLSHQTRVERRTTGHDEDLVDVAKILIGQSLLIEDDASGVEVTAQGVRDGVGLLLDLLVHEVLVAALFRGGEVPLDVERTGVTIRLAGEVVDLVRGGRDNDDLVLTEFDGFASVLDEGRDIRAEEHLPLADADDQRSGAAGGDDRVRVLRVHEDQREGSREAADHAEDAVDKVAGSRSVRIRVVNQVNGHLGVGVAQELDAGVLELGPQGAKFSMMPL